MPSVREVGSPADASAPDRTHLPHVPAPEHERHPRRVAPSRLRRVRPTPRQSAVIGSEAKPSGVGTGAAGAGRRPDGAVGEGGARPPSSAARWRFRGSCVRRASRWSGGAGRGTSSPPSGPHSASRGDFGLGRGTHRGGLEGGEVAEVRAAAGAEGRPGGGPGAPDPGLDPRQELPVQLLHLRGPSGPGKAVPSGPWPRRPAPPAPPPAVLRPPALPQRRWHGGGLEFCARIFAHEF